MYTYFHFCLLYKPRSAIRTILRVVALLKFAVACIFISDTANVNASLAFYCFLHELYFSFSLSSGKPSITTITIMSYIAALNRILCYCYAVSMIKDTILDVVVPFYYCKSLILVPCALQQ